MFPPKLGIIASLASPVFAILVSLGGTFACVGAASAKEAKPAYTAKEVALRKARKRATGYSHELPKEVKPSISAAYREYKKKNYAEAHKILSAVLLKQPDSKEARYARALISFEMERFEDALGDLDKVLKAHPNDLAGRMERGATLLELGNRNFDRSFHIRAIEDFTKATQLQPKNATAYNNRGLCYYYKGDFEQALADYKTACRLEPKEPKFVKNVATTYVHFGDYDKAKAEFEKARAIQPNNFYRYYDLGRLHLSRADATQAVESLNMCLRLNPNFAEGYMYRGLANFDRERYQDAITDFTKAIDLKIKNNSCYRFRGLAYTQIGDKEQAQKDLDHFSDEEVSKTHFEAGVDKILKTHGLDSVDSLISRGLQCEQASKFDEAIKIFTQALAINKRNPTVLKMRAHVYAQKRDWKPALADYDMSLWIDPFDADSLLQRALVYAAEGESEHALWDLNRAISADPTSPDAYFEKAVICQKIGKNAEASLNFRKFIKVALFRTGKGTREKMSKAREQLRAMEKR